MKIVLKKEGEYYYAYLNGDRKPTPFSSTADFREWAGVMSAHGLYTGAELYVVSEFGGLESVEPTYHHPCKDVGV